MTFSTRKMYEETLPLAFGCLNPEQLAEVFRDGRAAAFPIFEHLVLKHKLQRADERKYPADSIRLADGRILPMRTLTSNGVLLNLHKQNGYGRVFNAREHQLMLACIGGFIFVDVTKMPKITYAFVHKGRVPEGGSMTYDEGWGALVNVTSPDPY